MFILEANGYGSQSMGAESLSRTWKYLYKTRGKEWIQFDVGLDK